MINLHDASTNAPIGTISETQLQQIVNALEEESVEDRDYYINRATVDLLEQRGADASLVGMLRAALGDRDEMDIRWQPA
jgi:hypothetical protein